MFSPIAKNLTDNPQYKGKILRDIFCFPYSVLMGKKVYGESRL
jgi:hypothetical protein